MKPFQVTKKTSNGATYFEYRPKPETRVGDITITQLCTGWLNLSAIRNGFLVHHKFMGCTRREALSSFRLLHPKTK